MREFTDERGNVFEVEKELGKGGQGIVYKTTDADIAVKLILEDEKEIKDTDKIKLIQREIKKVIYKPFPKNLPIAKPLSVLASEAGYVMYLLEGMKPLSALFPQKLSKDLQIEIPFFLEEYAKKDRQGAEYIAYYLQTGSVRLRTKLLSRLAATLHRLHCRGMVYADVSYNNIFFNEEGIYLIDADNIEYAHTVLGSIRTPEFEVPEIMTGERNSIYSDIYAYSILAFYLLTMLHPFDGKLLENSWDGESKNIWEIPWVEDSNDPANESEKVSVRGALSVTPELEYLFHKVFEEGRLDKYKRPALNIWCEAFEKAYSKTVKCPKCSMTYYFDAFERCPYCDEKKPKRIEAESFYANGVKRWSFAKEITKKTVLKNYIFNPFEVGNLDGDFLEIVKEGGGYKLFFKSTQKLYVNDEVKISSIYSFTGQDLEKGIEIKTVDPFEIKVKIRICE